VLGPARWPVSACHISAGEWGTKPKTGDWQVAGRASTVKHCAAHAGTCNQGHRDEATPGTRCSCFRGKGLNWNWT
jgi:hypothetical protein